VALPLCSVKDKTKMVNLKTYPMVGQTLPSLLIRLVLTRESEATDSKMTMNPYFYHEIVSELIAIQTRVGGGVGVGGDALSRQARVEL
jgi:hypothetical protein